MGCRVPDFVLGDDNTVVTRKNPDSKEDIVELLWQNGPAYRWRYQDFPDTDYALPSRPEPPAPGASSHSAAAAAANPMSSTELFMEEDEMASWLYYPLGADDGTGGAVNVSGIDLPVPQRETVAAAALQRTWPEVMADRREQDGRWPSPGCPPLYPETQERSARLSNTNGPTRAAPPPSRELTVVDSSLTPELARARGPELRVSFNDGRGETGTCVHAAESSSWVSCDGDAAAEGAVTAARGDERKRKAMDDEYDSVSEEDAEFECSGKRRDYSRRPTSTRRTRAAEVHNLSERRRRDRINEKMKALHQLIPRCNKVATSATVVTDKASMLDDVIAYTKSLQMQVQMMSMCCNMIPWMFPGFRQYMPQVGMGIPLGMMGLGMRVEMAPGGLSRPIVTFPTVLPGAQTAAAVAAAHLSQRASPLQPLHAPAAAALAEQMRLQSTSQAHPASGSACIRIPSAVQAPNHGGFHSQVHPQNDRVISAEPGSGKETSMSQRPKLG